ncbi:MAG: hypothetical protein U0163_00185 [Gemmatimonadaceae bacterium]
MTELQAELDAIYSVFPDLKAAARKTSPAGSATHTVTEGEPRTRRAGKASWNAAARKAVSERMKRYWAGRRAQESAAATATKASKAAKPAKAAKSAKAPK